MESTFLLEADAMHLCQSGEHFTTLPTPAVAGGCPPPDYNKQIFYRENGAVERSAGLYYVLNRGDTLACFCQGGCGVGDPLDRDTIKVEEDVRNELVSVDKAAEHYGVVFDPETATVDEELTRKLRQKFWRRSGPISL